MWDQRGICASPALILPFGPAAWSGNGPSALNMKETPRHLEPCEMVQVRPLHFQYLIHPKPSTDEQCTARTGPQ